MRFSDFNGKEVIDINSGEKIGIIGHTDLVIDPKSGEIEALILPRNSIFGFKNKKEEIYISWNAIRKIGSDMIIIEKKNHLKTY
ncbi:hypothetical protein BHF71_00665 [Vulcanibacillus modesticaldus]|uniref:PRC-barrel domain-containing protein n=1 Tax=Vulcanibacillus modesticaldus TaxID=337097 RepID=A0A1D2YXP6_9BACI|nr:YlmC/YmxH family sporulation protein [Vulcanibacillus modesticaldus]OEG00453.1 hypothetical protein BHF71_00665 [Vulcanibacillus modesticaldus]